MCCLPGARGIPRRRPPARDGRAQSRTDTVWAASGEQGYKNDMHECTPKRIAYDVLACPYHKTFAQLGTPELCQLFCRNDEVCYGDLDGIRFVRTGTLAKGASHCDFLIERV